MSRLASDAELRARMGRAARERYLRLFSPKAVLPALERTYRRVAGNRTTQLQAELLEADAYKHPWLAPAEG